MDRLLAALVLVAALATGSGAASPAFRGGVLDPPRPAPPLALRASDGSEFRLEAQRGSVVVLFFGYTFCPDVCPLTLSEMVRVRERLGAGARRLRVAFVTVDPERDTVERLRAYVGAFHPSFLGLTGTPEQLAAARRAFGVKAERRVVAGTAAPYLIDHSALVHVVDPEGRLRLLFPFGTSVDVMAHDIGLLLGGMP